MLIDRKGHPWQKHQKGNTDGLQYEFTGPDGRTMSVDFLFDGVEENQSVAGPVGILETLATVRDPSSTDPEMRRPHHCVVIWGSVMGSASDGSDHFQCVITNVTVKYTMFSAQRRPAARDGHAQASGSDAGCRWRRAVTAGRRQQRRR